MTSSSPIVKIVSEQSNALRVGSEVATARYSQQRELIKYVTTYVMPNELKISSMNLYNYD